jgi:UDP-N-acetylglucosamine--N-acetylmuramyl-(pentapeptide) pyrophosphoryl-undecaprenol N-acetylglucosamine transferase
VLAVTGGSQGAAGINAALLSLQNELKGTIVLWSCGEKHHAALKDGVTGGNYRLYPFVERMDLFLAAADLVVSRAGATSLAEIAVAGKPSVLVPFPFATADHQTANAAGFAAAGAAVVVPEGENFRDRLAVAVAGLLADKKRLAAMGKAAAACYRQDTVERIIACVRDAAKKGHR